MSQTMVITPGDPAGIGPDIVAQLVTEQPDLDVTIIADPALMNRAARRLDLAVRFGTESGMVRCTGPTLHAVEQPGTLDPANGRYVLDCIDQAVEACVSGTAGAMVTGPVHKGVINDSGIPFSGHTEYLAQRTNTRKVVMLLAAGDLRVALLTTHIPLRRVADSITAELLQETIGIVDRDLRTRFNVARPRISVLGLNPHAGEGGHIGREELDVIEPTCRRLARSGLNVIGPLPADTAFTRAHLDQTDVVLAMYHDQGLPVLKYAGFGHAINVTLGLPIIRTSVDHGTALDLAGSGKASTGSLAAAVAVARKMANQHQRGAPV